MAVKTITLDLEAYELLRQRKRGNQSFSQVVKEQFHPRHTVGDVRRAIAEVDIESETLDLIDAQIAARAEEIARGEAL